MRSLLCSLLLLALVLALAACGTRESPEGKPPAKSPAPPAQLSSWKIELQAAEPIVSDKPVEFTATVKDASGEPVADAQVELSLAMKSMDMGENKARLTAAAPGVYGGKATFTMAGPWEVEVRATKNGLTALERFPYVVKQPGQSKK